MTFSIKDGVPLTRYSRGKTPIDGIVLHESVTNTRDDCVSVLMRKHLGVHLIVDRDGSITQHAPLTAACAHAEGFGKPSLHNERSVAIEVINRYYGDHAKASDLVIDAPWAHLGRYIVPTAIQLDALWFAVQDVVKKCDLRYEFPGLRRILLIGPKRFTWGRLSKHEVPGILAHHRWAHADGLVPEFYCLMRWLGHDPGTAYDLTIDAAKSPSRRTTITEAA